MEKRRPHHALARIKALVEAGAYKTTRTAFQCALRDFGFIESAQMANCVLAIEAKDFYKSMTTYQDSARWQDVYRPQIDGVMAYVKLQIVDDTTVVISFKSLEDE